jgi:acyl carrier protein
MDDTKHIIKAYILEEFLPGENPDLLTDSTPLVTGGILDSLATLKLVAFLQDQFHIEIEPHETSVEYMDSLPDIARLVDSKR